MGRLPWPAGARIRAERTRLLRLALLALVLGVSALVLRGLRRPAAVEGPAAAAPGQPATKVGNLVFLRFREGERAVELKARAMLGQEGEERRFSGVELRVPFVSEGQQRTLTIAADEGLYRAEPERALFTGHVRLRTDDGFELETESLRYRAQPLLEVRCDQPVVFRRGKSQGKAQTLYYREDGGIQLTGQVELHVEDEAGAPTEVRAPLASASRAEARVWFEGGVEVRQGQRELRSQRLQLNLTSDLKSIERAAAIEDAELVLGGSGRAPAAAGPAAGGIRRLRGRRINLAFRAPGVFEAVSAVNPASLEILPGPGESAERRLITGSELQLGFDEQGRLTALTALSAGPQGPPGQRRTVVLLSPVKGPGAERRIESGSLTAAFEPVAGELVSAEFEREVAFREPGRSAHAERARYQQAAGVVTLSGGEPSLREEARAGELRAQEIRIDTRTQAVSGSGAVRHRLGGIRAVGAAEEPPLALCQRFDYDPTTRTARYRENVLLRSGKDEIRAPAIDLEEPAPGSRRLRAEGGVVSTFVPQSKPGARRRSGPVEVRSESLLYDQQARRAVYTGAVEIRQGDVLTKTPEAVALLGPDGGVVERVLASGPVEIFQGARQASGERGSYTPQDETFVLEGDSVVLREGERRLTGRVLTFQAGSDRIRVDGRDEVRSEAVFRRSDTARP